MLGRRDLGDPAFVRSARSAPRAASAVEPARSARVGAGGVVASYALAAILVYFGGYHVTAGPAAAIEPLVSGSPVLSWLYDYLSAADTTRVIGGVELVTALLLVATPISSRFCLVGSLFAIAIFATTLSFLATTPGSFVHVADFPVPAPSPLGAFLMKDAFLLGTAAFALYEAVRALRLQQAPARSIRPEGPPP